MLLYKGLDSRIQKVTPSPAEMDAINTISLEPLSEEQVFIGRMALANDQYDRAYERFPDSYLKRFADTIVGKSVMTGHNYRELPVGRFFDANVHKVSGVKSLVPTYYMLADDSLVPKVRAGVLKGVSIGFQPDLRLCDICEKDYDGWWNDPDDDDPCFHIAGREYKIDGQKVTATITYGGDTQKVEAVEGSFVWLGCQHGAETIKQAPYLEAHVKSAYFAVKKKGGVWSMTANGLTVPAPFAPANGKPEEKDTKMDDKDKKDESGTDPKIIALTKAGERYKERMLERIKTRYAAIGMEGTGEALSTSLQACSHEEIEKAEAEAEKLFQERLGVKGTGTPESSGDAAATKGEFNPLAHVHEEYM